MTLQQFRVDKPAIWFSMAKGQFKIKAKAFKLHWFFHILAALTLQHQDRVSDIIELLSMILAVAFLQLKAGLHIPDLGTRSLFPGSLSALRSFHFHGSLSL